MALLFVSAAFGIFGLARQKLTRIPTIPTSDSCPAPPQLLPQCPPRLLTFNEARSIVRGLLRHKARPPRRALWYLNIRFAQNQRRPPRRHQICGHADTAPVMIATVAGVAETLVTQNARPLKNFGSQRRNDAFLPRFMRNAAKGDLERRQQRNAPIRGSLRAPRRTSQRPNAVCRRGKSVEGCSTQSVARLARRAPHR